MARDGYKPVPSGLRKVMNSTGMSDASVSLARKLAGNAQAVGHGKYIGAPASVIAGWNNERRAGAVVSESQPHGKDWQDAILLRSMAAMTIRRRR
ncbi:hypothetical protein CVS28_12560 [Arthrobacter glacialis]|nr:hypothetical protein CVS28_12560 [Arthrobacter glacialis]